MSFASKVVKSVAKKAVKEVSPKVAKGVSKVAKEVAEEEIGTAIPKLTRETIKQEAKEGITKVSGKEAQAAAEKGFAYTAQAIHKQGMSIEELSNWARETGAKIDAGELTSSQAMNEYSKMKSLRQIREEAKSATSGQAQTMKMASEDEATVRLNKLLPQIEEYQNKSDFRNTLNILENINDDKKLKSFGIILENQAKQGKVKNVFDKSMVFLKNMMLLQSPANRLLDGGANFFARGVSLLDIKTAEMVTKARKKISKFLPDGAIREMIASDGYINGEAAASLNGTLIAIKDSLVQTAENVKKTIKTRSTKGWVETPIGRHNKKISADYQWQRFHEFEDAALPNDLKGAFDFMANKSGFALSKGVDVFAGGSFRAGDVAQNALVTATKRAEEIGKAGDKKFIDEFSSFLIAADNGDKLPASQVKKYQSYFGNRGLDDMLESISKESGEAAARDSYRREAKTFFGKTLASADKGISKVPFVGRIYDAYFPLSRTGYKIADVFFEDNPIRQVKEAWKAIKIARQEITDTGKTSLRDFDKALGKFVTGSIAYAGAATLVYNNVLTGKLPTGPEGKMWRDKGIKAYSINIGGESIPYKRLGATANMLGTIADVMNDWKKFDEEYEDVSSTYGNVERGLDVLGIFVADPLWNVSFGDMIKDFQLGKVSKNAIQNYTALLPRMYDNLKQSLGFEPDEYLREMIANTGKTISDYKGSFKFRPRLDVFGKKLKSSYNIKENKLYDEIFNQSAFLQEPGYTAYVDGVEIELTGDERYAWREMLNRIHDKDTDLYYSTEDKLRALVSDVDPTRKGNDYTALDNVELDDEGVRKEYKRGVIVGTYNDCKKAALDTLLEYKDMIPSGDREKEYSKYATDIWMRAQKVKLEKMSKPIINKNIPPSTKPTLSIGK